VWYELAFVVGITNNLNSVADAVRCPLDFEPDGAPRRPRLALVEPDAASPEVKATFDDACAFYAMTRPPAVLRAMANDPAFARALWPAVRAAFEPEALDRLTKEVLALAASVTARSEYGIDFHLREVRRLGLPEAGVLEVLQVTQMFNGFTKIADALRLGPDDFAPVLRSE